MPKPFHCFAKGGYISEKDWPHFYFFLLSTHCKCHLESLKEKSKVQGTKEEPLWAGLCNFRIKDPLLNSDSPSCEFLLSLSTS